LLDQLLHPALDLARHQAVGAAEKLDISGETGEQRPSAAKAGCGKWLLPSESEEKKPAGAKALLILLHLWHD
jgi:hypothetical protein